MKKKSLRLFGILLVALMFSKNIFAVEFSIEDVSNQVVTCDSPLLINARPGSCLTVPNGTLFITATLEKGDSPDVLDNLHIVIHSKEGNFQYQSMASIEASERWQRIPVDELQGKLLLTSSFQRLPFETHSIGRQIHLERFTLVKGTKVYVGVRSNRSTGFLLGSIKEVFEVR